MTIPIWPTTILVLAVACSSQPDDNHVSSQVEVGKPAPPQALSVSWDRDTLHVKEFPGATMKYGRILGAQLSISTSGWPEGTSVSVGVTEWRIGGRRQRKRIEVSRKLGKLGLGPLRPTAKRGAKSVVSISYPVTIQIPGQWEPIEFAQPTEVDHNRIGAALAATRQGQPLVFADEGVAAGGAVDTAYLFGARRPVIGTGEFFQDLDWVAYTSSTPTGAHKKCRGYADHGDLRGSTARPLQVALHQTTLSIHDRRTGALLGEHTFPPAKKCPRTVSAKDPKVGASAEAMRAWIADRLAAGSVD